MEDDVEDDVEDEVEIKEVDNLPIDNDTIMTDKPNRITIGGDNTSDVSIIYVQYIFNVYLLYIKCILNVYLSLCLILYRKLDQMVQLLLKL